MRGGGLAAVSGKPRRQAGRSSNNTHLLEQTNLGTAHLDAAVDVDAEVLPGRRRRRWYCGSTAPAPSTPARRRQRHRRHHQRAVVVRRQDRQAGAARLRTRGGGGRRTEAAVESRLGGVWHARWARHLRPRSHPAAPLLSSPSPAPAPGPSSGRPRRSPSPCAAPAWAGQRSPAPPHRSRRPGWRPPRRWPRSSAPPPALAARSSHLRGRAGRQDGPAGQQGREWEPAGGTERPRWRDGALCIPAGDHPGTSSTRQYDAAVRRGDSPHCGSAASPSSSVDATSVITRRRSLPPLHNRRQQQQQHPHTCVRDSKGTTGQAATLACASRNTTPTSLPAYPPTPTPTPRHPHPPG